MINNCNFSYKHYKEIINLLKGHNYKFCSFYENPNSSEYKKVYLRHDVELSPKIALSLAELEHKEKINSIYCIRLSGPFYNVFETKNAKIIQEIINLGHEIGLHFEGDATVDMYNEKHPTVRMIEDVALKQLAVLKTYFKISKIVSFHRPGMARFTINKVFNKFVSTYSRDFFVKTKYLSDSSGIWREGCACQWLKKNKPPTSLQLLMHPFWWGRTNLNSDEYYYEKLQEHFKELDLLSAEENPFYKSRLSK